MLKGSSPLAPNYPKFNERSQYQTKCTHIKERENRERVYTSVQPKSTDRPISTLTNWYETEYLLTMLLYYPRYPFPFPRVHK